MSFQLPPSPVLIERIILHSLFFFSSSHNQRYKRSFSLTIWFSASSSTTRLSDWGEYGTNEPMPCLKATRYVIGKRPLHFSLTSQEDSRCAPRQPPPSTFPTITAKLSRLVIKHKFDNSDSIIVQGGVLEPVMTKQQV